MKTITQVLKSDIYLIYTVAIGTEIGHQNILYMKKLSLWINFQTSEDSALRIRYQHNKIPK